MSEKHRLVDLKDGGTHCGECNKVWFSRVSAEADHYSINPLDTETEGLLGCIPGILTMMPYLQKDAAEVVRRDIRAHIKTLLEARGRDDA